MTDEPQRRAVEVAGRLGLASRGVLWTTIGILAIRLATHGASAPGEEPDKQGAIRTLAERGGGRIVLAALVVGFVAMVVWSAIEAVQARDGKRGGHWGHRLAAVGRLAVYASLAVTTGRSLQAGRPAEGGGDKARVSGVLGWEHGRIVVGLVALGLFAAAASNAHRAITKRYERHWDDSRLVGWRRSVAGPIEAVGYLGHGAAFAVVGWFLLRAAVRFSAEEPTGLDEALAALLRGPFGPLLAGTVALGVVAWGLCSFVQAAGRQVPED